MQFKLDEHHRNVPDADYLGDIRVVAARAGDLTLSAGLYRECGGRYSPSAIANRFGGWTEALKRAGLTTWNSNGGVGRDEALADLKAVAARLRRTTLTREEYGENGRWSSNPLIRHFGTWSAALVAAGLTPSRRYRVPDDELFRNVERLWLLLGRQPHYGEIQKPLSEFAGGTYERRFGTWRKALEAFVAWTESPDEEPSGRPEGLEPVSEPSRVQKRRTPRTVGHRLRFRVLQRDGFRCRVCGATPALAPGIVLEADHIVPWSKGGETTADNLQATCQRCNQGKGDLTG